MGGAGGANSTLKYCKISITTSKGYYWFDRIDIQWYLTDPVNCKIKCKVIFPLN